MLVRSTVTRLRLRVHTQSQGSRSLRLAVRARNPRGLRWFEAKLARSALLARCCRRCDSLWPQSAWTRRATLPGTHRTVVLSVDADVVLVCCGGGGLVGAVAAALRLAHSKAKRAPLVNSPLKLHRTAPHRTAPHRTAPRSPTLLLRRLWATWLRLQPIPALHSVTSAIRAMPASTG